MNAITSLENFKNRLEVANSKSLEEKVHLLCEIIRDSRDFEDPEAQELRMRVMCNLNRIIKETPENIRY